ncbi:hypothetical protein LMG9673_04769 [Ralstonia pseudosolanacearum]|nr:hypothetical protein LMG9673_04769 [Ralstonia pseudosolanacearum]
MAAQARAKHSPVSGAAAAALLSNVATLVQMALLVAAIDIVLLRSLAVPLVVGTVMTVGWAVFWMLRDRTPVRAEGENACSSIDWRAAVGFGLWTAALLLVVAVSRAWFGTAAVTAVTLFGALADVHAATAAIATQAAGGALARSVAGALVMLALSVNTLTKVIVATSGGKTFAGQVAAGLLTALAASWAAFWIAA